MFLEIDGSLAWLYHCPLVHSLLHTMNQRYDRIPIIDRGHIGFVDPITRQTHPAANIQSCTDRIENFFNSTWTKKIHVYTNAWHCTPG